MDNNTLQTTRENTQDFILIFRPACKKEDKKQQIFRCKLSQECLSLEYL